MRNNADLYDPEWICEWNITFINISYLISLKKVATFLHEEVKVDISGM